MTGYSDFSKSNNAIAAERDGRHPLTRAAKLARVPKELIKKFVGTREWHHTSGWYNRVDYYSVEDIRETFGLYGNLDGSEPDAVAALVAWKRIKFEVIVHAGQTVEWIEWSGSRNYPKATERRAEGCTVAVKGQTATIKLPSGEMVTKRLSTRGFSFRRPA